MTVGSLNVGSVTGTRTKCHWLLSKQDRKHYIAQSSCEIKTGDELIICFLYGTNITSYDGCMQIALKKNSSIDVATYVVSSLSVDTVPSGIGAFLL